MAIEQWLSVIVQYWVPGMARIGDTPDKNACATRVMLNSE
jgi:hypothetical protein